MFKVEILKTANREVLSQINSLTAKLSLSTIPPKPLDLEILKKLLSQKSFYILVVRDKNIIVGLLNLYFTQITTGFIGELEDLIVAEPYRKWGLAIALIKEAVDIAEKMGAKHISARVNPKRIEANKVYPAMGFLKMETNFYRINLPRKK